MKRFGVMAWLWVGALLAAGLGGGLVVSRVGWSLAMGLAIYGGNTEPVRPDLPFPWTVFVLAVLAAVAGLAWSAVAERRRAPGQTAGLVETVAPYAVAYAGGLLAAVLPFIQIYRLWSVVS